MRWDFHKHKNFTECPRKYKFEADRVEPTTKDNRYYAVRGTVMQKFFELVSNGHYPKNKDFGFEQVRKFLKPFYDRELSYNFVDWKSPMSKFDRDGLLDDIVEIIVKNMEKQDLYTSGTASEVKIQVTLKNGDELVGKLDFIKDFEDGTVAILDGKSTGTLNKNIDLDQLLFYAWLYKVKRGRIPDKLGFMYYQLLLLDWKRFDKQDIEKAVRSVLGTLHAAKTAQSFLPTPSASACKYCSYLDKCPEGRASKDSRKRGSRNKTVEDAIQMSSDGFLLPPSKKET